MRRKIPDRTIVTFLAILLIAEILLLFGNMGLLPFTTRAAQTSEVLAGHITQAENDLRRRSSSSLVWENSHDEEAIYFHDSVLTLSQSAATLNLEDKTQIHMSENTLVTIEPRDKDHPGEIRLRFRKGGIRTANPAANMMVDTETWSLDIKSGSDVDIRRDGDTYEALIRAGEAKFEGPAGPTQLSAHQILKIAGQKITRAQIDESIVWQKMPPTRLYTHTGTATVALTWQGTPTQVRHQWQNHDETLLPLQQHQSQIEIPLELGWHTVTLQDDNGTSLPVDVQVWKAPLVHLLNPLPRDRVRIDNDVSFFWTFVPGLSGYRFELHGANHNVVQSLTDNTAPMKFSQEDDAKWEVFGQDKEGFEIPPPYQYPIYIRQNPFAPPKLKTPEMRKPASQGQRGASWLQKLSEFLLPTARADEEEKVEAVFAWEKVEGADLYVIEIADAPDFRDPLVNESSAKPQFVWSNFPSKKIYWRVAAGSRRGRMGVFSEVAVVNFQNISKGANSIDGVQLRKIAPLATEVAVAPTPRPTPEPTPIAKQPDPVPASPPRPPLPDKHLTPGLMIAYRPAYNLWSGSADSNTHAQLSGGSGAGATAEWRKAFSSDQLLRSELDISQFQYRPHPVSEFPFQQDLGWTQIEASAFLHGPTQRFGYGGVIAQNFGIGRSGNESITAKPNLSVGPAMEGAWTFGPYEFLGDLAAMIGTGEGLSSKQQLRWRYHQVLFGGSVEGDFFFHFGGSDWSVTGALLLGVQF